MSDEFKCPLCGQVFAKIGHRSNHLATEHPAFTWPDHLRKKITEEREVDLDRLYAPIPKMIEYLQEVQKEFPLAGLEYEQQGYEDWTWNWTWQRDETDEEFARRWERVQEQDKYGREQRQKAQAGANAAVLARLNEIEREAGLPLTKKLPQNAKVPPRPKPY